MNEMLLNLDKDQSSHSTPPLRAWQLEVKEYLIIVCIWVEIEKASFVSITVAQFDETTFLKSNRMVTTFFARNAEKVCSFS